MAKVKKKETLSQEEKLEQTLIPIDEQPYKLPKNWCWTKLSAISEVVTGSTPSKSKPEYYGDNFPFFKPADLDAGRNTVVASEYLSDEGKGVSRIIPAQSTAVCCIGSIGKSGYLEVEGTTNQQINSVIPKINPLYLYYFINTDVFVNELWEKASATTISIVNKSKMESNVVPLAPLVEQQRIVEQIEKLFAMLDEAKEKAQEALESFDKRKASILNKAIRGELTIEWRKNNQIDLASWDNVKFKDFCLLKRGYDLPTNERVLGDFPLVTSSGVNDYICEYKVKAPGVVTGRSGTIGKVFLVEDDYWPLNTTLYSENLYENEPEYVYYFLQTFDLKKYSSSTAVPTLNRNLFSDVIVSVPTKEEQIQIVKVIKRLLDSEEHIKELIVNTINDIDIMKKTVLAKAFRGELCTNSPNDESAVELLKSILAIG